MSHLHRIVRPGLDAIRLLWLPFVLLQLLGLLLVLAYFYVPAVASACDAFGELKVRTGLLFAAISMPIASAIVPEVFKYLSGVDRRFSRERGTLVLHNIVLFCVGGITVDLFYTWSGRTFGPSTSIGLIVLKVLMDMLVYTPLWGIPIVAFAYGLRTAHYHPSAALRMIGPRWYLREVVPVLVTGWAYWFPMSALMYTLPTSLTFAYGLVASAASATLLTAVAGRAAPKMADGHV